MQTGFGLIVLSTACQDARIESFTSYVYVLRMFVLEQRHVDSLARYFGSFEQARVQVHALRKQPAQAHLFFFGDAHRLFKRGVMIQGDAPEQ